MKLLTLILIVTAAHAALGQIENDPHVVRIEANPQKGFSYAYYLYVPPVGAGESGERSILVIPNNTGKISDDIAVHDADVKRKITHIGPLLAAQAAPIPILVPVFPRPATEHRIYTHSLDRDSLITENKKFSPSTCSF